jgi:hypothetical protein
MASAQPTTLPKPASTSDAAISDFRLGENDLSDASDSDQSAHSERSLSPSGAKKSKAKKKKERKQVGALTDELGTLLGAAFQTPNADSEQPDASTGMLAICNAPRRRTHLLIFGLHGFFEKTVRLTMSCRNY